MTPSVLLSAWQLSRSASVCSQKADRRVSAAAATRERVPESKACLSRVPRVCVDGPAPGRRADASRRSGRRASRQRRARQTTTPAAIREPRATAGAQKRRGVG
eukprot:3293497-Pleurochrysis_carterae.AAC.2